MLRPRGGSAKCPAIDVPHESTHLPFQTRLGNIRDASIRIISRKKNRTICHSFSKIIGLHGIHDPQMVTLFNVPADLEPWLPGASQIDGLLEKAHDLRTEAARLSGVFQTGMGQELAKLLLAMNSYYSNQIEGEHASPLEIGRALVGGFSCDADRARRQRLAVAHTETERWLHEPSRATGDLYTVQTLRDIHAHLFGPLSDSDRHVRLPNKQGKATEAVMVSPGAFRTRHVAIGHHIPPDWKVLDALLRHWSAVYGGVRRGEMQIVAAAAAHHRLVWIHPFLDGNGRTARLHTMAVLQSLGLTAGLWSPLRGLARSGDRYHEKLSNADMPRNSQDGQHSERMLAEWIDFFLDVCLDQVRCMGRMLNLQEMQGRMEALLAHEEQVIKRGLRKEALRPLHYLFATQGALTRGDFASMTGLGERTATTLIGKLLATGLLQSDSPRGLVRFGVPMDALRFLFPNLWPEAEADVASVYEGET
ncbi:MAG: Fic family protein [Acidovorax sp.]